jgi:hypothetical protein
MLIPRRPGLICSGKSRSPAGERLADPEKALPPRGMDISKEISLIGRRGIDIFPCNLAIPRGGLAFRALNGLLPAGERDLPRKATPCRRGNEIFRVQTRPDRGSKAFRPAAAFPDAGDQVVGGQRGAGAQEIALSNHYHLLVAPTDAEQLAEFMGFVNSNIAREVGRLVRLQDNRSPRALAAPLPLKSRRGAAARSHPKHHRGNRRCGGRPRRERGHGARLLQTSETASPCPAEPDQEIAGT